MTVRKNPIGSILSKLVKNFPRLSWGKFFNDSQVADVTFSYFPFFNFLE
jgi:hypothetical protein